MWGIQVGRVDGKPKVFGVLDDDERDDNTATTIMLTDLDEMDSESEDDLDDGEDFAVENAPRPPRETPLYGGNGKSRRGTDACVTPTAGQRSGTTTRPARRRQERGPGAGETSKPPPHGSRGTRRHNEPSSQSWEPRAESNERASLPAQNRGQEVTSEPPSLKAGSNERASFASKNRGQEVTSEPPSLKAGSNERASFASKN